MRALLLGTSPAERRLASLALYRCPRVDLDARAVLGPSELPESRLLLVENGVVLLAASRPGLRRPGVLALCGRGAVLAPLAADELLQALTRARVVAVPPQTLDALLSLPSVAKALLERLLEALRERQRSLGSRQSAHPQRLLETLFQLAREHGKVVSDGVRIDLPLTHELLARMVGSARETVTCTLTRFQRDGILARSGRSYRLTVPPELIEQGMPELRPPGEPAVPSRRRLRAAV